MHKEFDRSLARIAKPILEEYGYNFDGKRRFKKRTTDGEDLVIEYQIGIRSAQGTFTVNLIARGTTERLSMINPTPFSKFVNRIFGNYDPWWKGIFLPKDTWWRISPFQEEMDAIMKKTVIDLKAYGVAWLEAQT